MITHQEQYLTAYGPMKEWFDRARRWRADGRALAVSLFPMQPWLDVEQAGWSVAVVADGDQDAAESLADEFADLAWSMRHRFMEQESLSVDAALRYATIPRAASSSSATPATRSSAARAATARRSSRRSWRGDGDTGRSCRSSTRSSHAGSPPHRRRHGHGRHRWLGQLVLVAAVGHRDGASLGDGVVELVGLPQGSVDSGRPPSSTSVTSPSW